jgi:hypothetical protein
VRGQRHAPAALYPLGKPGTHCTGGWVDPRAGLDRCGKSRPPPGFDSRTVQPVASRYTDHATRPTRYTALLQNIYEPVSKYAKQFKKEYRLPLVLGLIKNMMSLVSQQTCNFPASFLFPLWDITRHVQKYDIYSISLQTGTAEPRLLKRR